MFQLVYHTLHIIFDLSKAFDAIDPNFIECKLYNQDSRSLFLRMISAINNRSSFTQLFVKHELFAHPCTDIYEIFLYEIKSTEVYQLLLFIVMVQENCIYLSIP